MSWRRPPQWSRAREHKRVQDGPLGHDGADGKHTGSKDGTERAGVWWRVVADTQQGAQLMMDGPPRPPSSEALRPPEKGTGLGSPAPAPTSSTGKLKSSFPRGMIRELELCVTGETQRNSRDSGMWSDRPDGERQGLFLLDHVRPVVL